MGLMSMEGLYFTHIVLVDLYDISDIDVYCSANCYFFCKMQLFFICLKIH